MKRINKWIVLAVIFAAAVLFLVIYTLIEGGHYTMRTSTYLRDMPEDSVYAEYDKEGVVELTNAYLSDNRIEESRELVLEFDAVNPGKTGVTVHYDARFGDETVSEFRTYELKVTNFGLLIDSTYVYINFQTYPVLLIVFMLVIAITMVMLIISFIQYKNDGDFNYKMIAFVGLLIFFGVLMLVLVYKLANNCLKTFSEFVGIFMDIGYEIMLLISPFMLLLSVLLAISNIWLMRHEGFRPVNALGIVFGVLWTAATVLSLFTSVFPVVQNVVNPSVFQRSILYLSCYFGSMFLGTVICAYLATKYRPPYDRDYIIILGCGIRADGTLTPLLRGRVDAALKFEQEQFEKTGKHAIFVPSGGQGADEVISESRAMTNYLLEQGVPQERILLEDKSTNTMQNMQFSKAVIQQHADCFEDSKIAFATTNYHIFRGYILAKKNGFIAKGISAKTKEYFFPNAFLREFIGLLYDQKIRHIIFVAITLCVFVMFDYFQRVL